MTLDSLRRRRRNGRAIAAGWLALCVAQFAVAQETQTPELLRTDSRSPYVHRITLYDHDGAAIDPSDPAAPPYSPAMTCGKCHPVGQVARGWHFNAATQHADPGRPGEPWLLVDAASGTVLPLSARGWRGTFTPEQAGLTHWAFIERFGRHTPGGGLADPSPQVQDDSDESLRWMISGTQQIDCMTCHSADFQHDAAETERQIAKQNFKWIPTAALGVAAVRGEAKNLPDDFDPLAPPNPDRPDLQPPRLVYDETRFDPDDRYLFSVTRRPPAERCYFCHTSRQVGPAAPARSETHGDVHLAAGLTCVDCHRNGIEHDIVRGYEYEVTANPAAASLTCRGCHLGEENAADPAARLGGHLRAPHPQHNGIPAIHFERLTCTACHSGSWPKETASMFQTSMAHGLGVPSRTRSDASPPEIVAPVFASQPNGTIAPHKAVWPAYWGALKGDNVAPLNFETVEQAIRRVARAEEHTAHSDPPLREFTDEQIVAILQALQPAAGQDAQAVYVRDGRIARLRPDGTLERTPHAAARPYTWALAHDVRPASQSLGVRGCTDCHADGAPFYFGRLAAATQPAGRPDLRMADLQNTDKTLNQFWTLAFAGRSAFKWIGFFCVLIVLMVAMRFGR